MDFLLFPPSKKDKIRNSFRGARKHGKFLSEIELEFGICSTLLDYDSVFGFDGFDQKVIERMSKEKGNRIIIKERMKEKNYFVFEIVTLLILVSLFYFLGIH